MKLRHTLAASLSLAASLPALAEIKVNDMLSISGYAAGSYQYFKPSGGSATDSLFNGAKSTPSADALRTLFTLNLKPVTGNVSLFYIPNIPAGVMRNELTVLDAYATYDAGGGFSVTAGKFLSYLGYEAFHPDSMNQITYGHVTVGVLGGIPAYHSGVRLDYADKEIGYGFALVDSVYSPFGIDKGDGELKKNAGFEGYVTSMGLGDFKLWAGFAYDTKGNFQNHSVLTLNVWGEYKVSKEATVALEFLSKNGGAFSKGTTWLAYMNYQFTPMVSTVFRVSGEDLGDRTAGRNSTRYTVGPNFKLSENLMVRTEYTYNKFNGGGTGSIFSVQGLLKF
jgi:hypothetical protein